MKGRVSRLLAAFGLALAFAALAGASASAEYRHLAATAVFGPDGTPASAFSALNTLAYQQASDRLFVLDVAGDVYGFGHSAPGAFAPLGGGFPIAVGALNFDSDLAVDNSAGPSAGYLYLTPDGPTISAFDPAGALLPTAYEGEREICGVAVDSGGRIWGGRYPDSAAVQFAPGAAAIAKVVDTSAGAASPCKVAVDQSNDDLYVSSWSGAGVWQYSAASGYAAGREIAPGANLRIAVNGAKHVLYVGGANSEGKVRAYDTVSGDLLETIEPPGADIRGLAVDEATDTLFVGVGETNRVVEMPGVIAPKASTGAPIAEAEVGGSADPDGAGPITGCTFAFGQTTAYGSQQPCDQALPIAAPTTLTATLPGLTRETTYHYRVVVSTAAGTVVRGVDRTLTLHHVRELRTDAASAVNRTSALLHGSFRGTGEATSYYFEYGHSTDYGSRYPPAPGEEAAAPATGPVSISAPIAGLEPGATYHFRVVAKNAQGASHADDVEFQTPPAVAAVLTEAPAAVTKTTATLRGSFDGATNDTPPGPLESFHYYFEWGETPGYGNVTAAPPGVDAGAHAETVHVAAPVSGLSIHLPTSSPYHYRLVVANSLGTTYGADVAFETQPPDVPRIVDSRAEGVGPTTATIRASVNPGADRTEYAVQYGPSQKYSEVTQKRTLAVDDSDQPIAEALAGLAPGTVYHYRVVASNSSGTGAGPDQTFTTPNLPAVESSEAAAAATTARVTFAVVANARPTEVRVEYGRDGGYGTGIDPVAIEPSLDPRSVGFELGGLQPGTTYHYRARASNEIGTALGPDQTFVTQPAPAAGEAPQPKRCKRGFAKRKGKCVRRHRKPHGRHHRGRR